ncbi:MAG: hypothetical protein ABI051_14815 [Vicinamibacterales bacterium]
MKPSTHRVVLLLLRIREWGATLGSPGEHTEDHWKRGEIDMAELITDSEELWLTAPGDKLEADEDGAVEDDDLDDDEDDDFDDDDEEADDETEEDTETT